MPSIPLENKIVGGAHTSGVAVNLWMNKVTLCHARVEVVRVRSCCQW